MVRRFRRRYFRKRGKWSSNIYELPTTQIQAPANTTFFVTQTIAENPVQNINGVSQPYTVKNIEFSFYIDKDDTSSIEHIEDVSAYIMYVPQGMNITKDFNIQHPEYIMAWKLLGSPSIDYDQSASIGQQYQPRKISTRLSRKLNTGDSVVIFIKGVNVSTTYSTSFDIHGILRWWTKAN